MKIFIICPDFKKSNVRKFPWNYIYQIALYLEKNNKVFIVSDKKSDINDIKVISVKKIFQIGKGETEELLHVIKKESPDTCIMLLGLSSFIRSEFKIEVPVYGIITSPPYHFRELVKNIGLKDSLKYRKYTAIHYLNSFIPKFMVKKWSQKFSKIIFLSEYTRKRSIKKGCPIDKCILIPAGIEKNFSEDLDTLTVENLRKNINPTNVPIIMFYTSPLTLRGTDTLIKAFNILRSYRECKLIFLSRIDHKELLREEEILKEIARKNGMFNSVIFLSKYLNPQEVKEYLSIADLICLPFKIVISDIPISILEAMSMGKPVISTDVACIPELVDEKLLVSPNNENELSRVLCKLLDNEDLSHDLVNKGFDFISKNPSWDEVGKLLEANIKSE